MKYGNNNYCSNNNNNNCDIAAVHVFIINFYYFMTRLNQTL